MKLRKMKISDFEELYALWKQADLTVASFEKEKKELEMMIELYPNSCLVELNDNKIIGSILGVFNGRRAWIYHLAIHPGFQKRGLGSMLLKKAQIALKKVGAERVLLWVDKDNLGVIPFYLKNGYSNVGDAIVMGKDLGKE